MAAQLNSFLRLCGAKTHTHFKRSMGKKKSKTAKKKQAKAASRAKQKAKTTAFGVSVVKGSKGRGGAAAGGGGNGGNDHAASFMGHNTNIKKSGGGGRSNATSSSANDAMQHETTRRAVSKDDERNEFDRQHASLQERVEARQQKAGGKKRGNRKHQQHTQESQASSLFTNLAQSSIKLGPATVGEMVDDAADRVAAGMTAIGAALSPVGGTAGRPVAPPNTPSSIGGVGGNTNMLQVLAAQKRQEWSAQKYMLQPESTAKDDQMGDNRFAGLDNGDSDFDDNGWGADGDQPVDAPPAFNFAPASFAFGQNNTASAQQPPGGDDDPDL